MKNYNNLNELHNIYSKELVKLRENHNGNKSLYTHVMKEFVEFYEKENELEHKLEMIQGDMNSELLISMGIKKESDND